MRIEHYSFTRGADMDYGVFSSPCNLKKVQLDIVKAKLMSILGDDVDGDLCIPKWILYKDSDFLFWGVCCENRLLASNDRESTHKNRPVRGFFSIVITEFNGEKLKLPFDINYFRELYLKEVATYWDQQEKHQNSTSGFIEGKFNYISEGYNPYVDLLNTDIFQCKSLGILDKEGVLAAALTLNNVSLLIDNDNIQQATNRKGSFMNCLSSSVQSGMHYVMQQCPKCKKYVSAFTNTGVCINCKDVEDIKVIVRKEDMDKQMKIDLEKAHNRIAELESEVEALNFQLKKKSRFLIILIIVSMFLFLALLYTQNQISFKFFEMGNKTMFPPDTTQQICKQ